MPRLRREGTRRLLLDPVMVAKALAVGVGGMRSSSAPGPCSCIEVRSDHDPDVERCQRLQLLVEPPTVTSVVAEAALSLSESDERQADVRRDLFAELRALCVVWMAGMLLVLPALRRGSMLGNYDWLRSIGLTAIPGSPPGNGFQADVIRQMIPWSNVAWIQVHHGQLPLWNPYNLVGSPLAFNWQSGTFSVPALLGYLSPLRASFTVQVISVVVLAGTGAYGCGRAIGLTRMSSAWAGISFCLSGTMVYWLGWSATGVLGLMGWLLAAAIMVCRSERRAWRWWSVALALAVAATIYGGQLDVLGAEVVILVASLLLVQLGSALRQGGWREALVPFGRLAPGAVAGLLLGAPLLLPGVQLARHAVRAASSSAFTLSPVGAGQMLHELIPGIVTHSIPLELDSIGAVVSLLAVVGIVSGWRRRAVRISLCAIAFQVLLATPTPLHDLAAALPLVGNLRFPRSMLIMVFFMALLSAVGLDALRRGAPLARRTAAVTLAVLVGVFVTSLLVSGHVGDLGSFATRVRFIWTAVTMLLVLSWLLLLRATGERQHPMIGTRSAGVLLVVEVLFLVAAGSSWITSSATGFPQTPATQLLQETVGSDAVGFGHADIQGGVGIEVNANAAYGVHEIAAYDPMIPMRVFDAWTGETGHVGWRWASTFLPSFETVTEARVWGARWIIEPAGSTGPEGTRMVERLGQQTLWKVPRAWQASQAPLGAAVGDPREHGISLHWRSPSHGVASVSAATASVLRLRVLNVPGWTATLDGTEVPLRPFAGAMMQMRVPRGHHILEIRYLPTGFVLGLVVAGLVVVGLLVMAIVDLASRRRRTSCGVEQVSEVR